MPRVEREIAMHAAKSPPRAFTKLELLVVVGILGCLLGLLAPAVLRTRTAAAKLSDL